MIAVASGARPAGARRVRSVDALRGLAVAAMLVVNDAGDWGHVYPWLEHAAWNGLTVGDLVFPLFLFIVGVSAFLALEPRLAAGAAPAALARSVLLRAGRLVVLGIALNLVAAWLIPGRAVRLPGVLQRIGLCYCAAGLATIQLRDARAQWILFATLLLGYALILAAGGPLAPDVNLADRFDATLLRGFAYAYDPASGAGHDPEGLLSTIPAVATTLLGIRAGAWLRADARRRLVVASLAALAAGTCATTLIPINKQLWTPSYVLVTGGIGLLLLAVAHELIDRRGQLPLGESLGINAIGIYAGAWVAECLLAAWPVFAQSYAAFAVALPAALGPEFASLCYAAMFTAAWWALAAWLKARGWRFRI